jgi:hypothetical protein
VGDEEEGGLHPALEMLQEELHLPAHIGIERRERLVQQQDLRGADQGAGKRHALALPAGERVGMARLEAGEPTMPSASSTLARISALGRLRTISP